jgi:hypothetical protein
MKYNIRKFNAAVTYYKKKLGNIKKKNLIFIFDTTNFDAFLSMAPLSRAVHELGGDMNAIGREHHSKMMQVLFNIWLINDDLKKKKVTKETKALKAFIDETSKKAKGFKNLLKKPEIIIKATPEEFIGNVTMDFKTEWFKKHKWNLLQKTCNVIYDQVYNLKKGERVSVGFELMITKKEMEKPLEDYLDSYAISWSMMLAAKKRGPVSMGATSPRFDMLKPMNKISDLRATILGCELSKDINEPVFKKFKALSKFIHSDRLKVADANFFISGKGYPGKHLFGMAIGYPDPNKKTRWQSPGMFIYKLDYYPQTKLDCRKPMSRVGFTDTLPIDTFIRTCNIDWMEMKRKDDKLRIITEKSEKIIVKSNVKEKYQTNFEVGLIMPNGNHRWARGSDVDIRHKINKDYLKRTGIVAGTMANLPGGEMFTTPEYLKGTIAGDVVISIDQSYMLNHKDPLVIEATGNGYKIVRGPKKIITKFDEKKKQAWKMIKKQEQSKSIPKEITDLKKANFNRIGEFAINTNPKAKLSGYLIVDEKIANMIHIAMGSGFEPDRATEYHTDVVINAKRQKLDIYGVKGKQKFWMLKKGKFVI